VSALIGKNGSGKTNILELLTYILFNPKSIAADSEFILLYTREFGWRDEEVKVFHNLSNADRVRGTNLELSFTSIYEQLDKNNDFKCIFFSNIIDSVKRVLPSGVVNISNGTSSQFFGSRRSNILYDMDFYNSGVAERFGFQYPERVTIRFPIQNSSQLSHYDSLKDIRGKILKSNSNSTLRYWLLYYLLI